MSRAEMEGRDKESVLKEVGESEGVSCRHERNAAADYPRVTSSSSDAARQQQQCLSGAI